MDSFNLAITSLFDLYFGLFADSSPWIGLVILSLVTGIILLFVFKLTSNQKAISQTKERIRGHFLEIRLFQDDPVVIFGSLGRIMRDNLIYLRYTAVPFFFMLVPVVLMLIQMDMRYGYRPFRPGEETILRIKTTEEKTVALDSIGIDTPEFMEVNVMPVRIAAEGEALWGLKITGEGRGEITVEANGNEYAMPVVAGGGVPRAAGARSGGSLYDRLMNPGLKALPAGSGLEIIEIEYPAREMTIGNYNIHWIIIYFVISVVFGYSVKGLFGVEV